MGLMVAIAAVSLAGCGIPVKLSKPIDLIKNVEVPAMPATAELIDVEIPQEVRDMYPDVDWDNPEAALTELADTGLEYQREEKFCELPDLQELRDEAAKELPAFLAKRIEVREAIVTSIRVIAETGDFSSILEFEDKIEIGGQEYVFTISDTSESAKVLTLTSNPPLDLADVINNSDTIDCIQNHLKITGTLPDAELLFKAVMDLDIMLYLRIL